MFSTDKLPCIIFFPFLLYLFIYFYSTRVCFLLLFGYGGIALIFWCFSEACFVTQKILPSSTLSRIHENVYKTYFFLKRTCDVLVSLYSCHCLSGDGNDDVMMLVCVFSVRSDELLW